MDELHENAQNETALIREIYSEKLARARAMSPDEKLRAGVELFEMGIEIMRDGIRDQFPLFNDDEVEAEIDRRLARSSELENVLWPVNDLLPPP